MSNSNTNRQVDKAVAVEKSTWQDDLAMLEKAFVHDSAEIRDLDFTRRSLTLAVALAGMVKERQAGFPLGPSVIVAYSSLTRSRNFFAKASSGRETDDTVASFNAASDTVLVDFFDMLKSGLEDASAAVRDAAPPKTVIFNSNVLLDSSLRALVVNTLSKAKLVDATIALGDATARVAELSKVDAVAKKSLRAALASAMTMKAYGKQCIGLEYCLRHIIEEPPKPTHLRAVALEVSDVLKKKGCGTSWILPEYMAKLLDSMVQAPQVLTPAAG